MLKAYLCLAMSLSLVQLNSTKFHVEQVEAVTKYDSYYIHDLAYMILPPDELRGEDDVRCLVDELKASGMFANVEAELLRTEDKDARKLTINTVYNPRIKSFVITEITLRDFPAVDPGRFQSALNAAGVKAHIPFLRYPFSDLRERIREALRKTSAKDPTDDDHPSVWVTIRPDGARKLKLIVSPTYSGCNLPVKG